MADDPTKAPAPADPDGDEPETDPLDDDPEGGDGDEPEEWTPPTREQWKAQQAALDAEKAKLKRARDQAKRLREGKGAEPAGEGGQPAAGGGEVDVWKGRAVRAAAKAELIDRGADPDMVDLALARLKPGEIEFDADDEPELDDWLDEMQERYPKLFAKTPAAPTQEPRPRPGRVNQAAPANGTPARPKMSLGEAIIAKSEAARLAGRRGIRG